MSKKREINQDFFFNKNDKSTFGNDLTQASVICCTCIIHAGRPAVAPSSLCSSPSRSQIKKNK